MSVTTPETPTAGPLAVGQVAPDLSVEDMDGATAPLRERWAVRPLVLVFIRHFG
jgi:hypothetical protein